MTKTDFWTGTAAEQKLLDHIASVVTPPGAAVLGAVCVDDDVYAVIRNEYNGRLFYNVVAWCTRAKELPSANAINYLGYEARQPDFLYDGDVLYNVAPEVYVEPMCGDVVVLLQEDTPVLTVHRQTVTTVTFNSGDRVRHKFVYEEED